LDALEVYRKKSLSAYGSEIPYHEVPTRPELAEHRVPTDVDWASAITELYFPYMESQVGSLHINSIERMVVRKGNLYIDCHLYDPDWSH